MQQEDAIMDDGAMAEKTDEESRERKPKSKKRAAKKSVKKPSRPTRPLTNDEITEVLGVLRKYVQLAKAREKKRTLIATTAMAEAVLFRLYPDWQIEIEKHPLDFSVSLAKTILRQLLINHHRYRDAKMREKGLKRVREKKEREEGELPIEDAQQWREMSPEEKLMMLEVLDLIESEGGRRVERVYVLRTFFRFENQEIADQLGLSVDTVIRDRKKAHEIARRYLVN